MDLKDLRDDIDRIDDDIARLYTKRLALVKQVGEFKKQNGVEVEHSDREKQILDRLALLCGEENRKAINFLYAGIITYSKTLQAEGDGKEFVFKKSQKDVHAEKSVGLAGAKGAYADKAAHAFFKDVEPKFYHDFGDVFAAVNKGEVKYGLVPIENSTAGSVNEVYDLLKDYNMKIVGANRLTVSHCLFGTPDSTLEDIKTVYSHPQALYQCRRFLAANGIQPIEESNTAVACRKIAELGDKTAGAIGAKENENLPGVKLLKTNLQDAEHNFTRFIVISKELTVPQDADRLSLMLSLKHKPGTLFQLMSILYAYGVNLHKLESRPIPEQKFEFMFYLDLECDVFSQDTAKMLSLLKAYCQTMTILGVYKEVL